MRGNCTSNWWRLLSDITQRLRARMPIWPQKKAGGGLLENTIVRLGLVMKLGIWLLTCFTVTVVGDGLSCFFLKVSKTFH